MKNFIEALLVTVLFTGAAFGQNNRVLCENLVNGGTQQFPGMSCPPGWFPL